MDRVTELECLLREARDALFVGLDDDCGNPACQDCAGYRLRDRIDAALRTAVQESEHHE